MPLDPNILREAKEVLAFYSRPAQEQIKQNLYGPREARLAGAIVANSFTVEVCLEPPPETVRLQELRVHATEQIAALCRRLRQMTEIVEERVAGYAVLVEECNDAIAEAEEDFCIDEDGGYEDEPEVPSKRQVFVIVFPPLSSDETGVTGEINTFVGKLKDRGIATWVADENDQTKRLKAMTIREIYNVGRVAAVVLTDKDGTVLDGWYNGMPWIEETLTKIQELAG
jgi:hypothetical protein